MASNNSAPEISLEDLKTIINIILEQAQDDLGSNMLKLDHDFYYQIGLNETYNFSDEEPEVLIGQLYDDLEFLKKILDDRERGVTLMLDHLAPILRYISFKINPK